MSKKQLIGTVVSTHMHNTVVVKVDQVVKHALYEKRFVRSKKYYAHSGQDEIHAGDTVRIEETRPLSKQKRWNVVERITKSDSV